MYIQIAAVPSRPKPGKGVPPGLKTSRRVSINLVLDPVHAHSDPRGDPKWNGGPSAVHLRFLGALSDDINMCSIHDP